MQDAWKPNDEKHEDEELTVTEHRDGPTPDQEVMSEGGQKILRLKCRIETKRKPSKILVKT